MRIADFTPESLRYFVEQQGGFQLAIAAVYPRLFPGVREVSEQLHRQLEAEGFVVLLDDRNQKPRNMFKVIEFLQIPHRLTVSNRALEAGVYEYRNLLTDEHQKVKRDEILEFLQRIIQT